MASDNFEMLVILFKNVRNFVDGKNLFKALDSIKLTKQQYLAAYSQLESDSANLEKLI